MKLDYVSMNYHPSTDNTHFSLTFTFGKDRFFIDLPHGMNHKELAKELKKLSKTIKHSTN